MTATDGQREDGVYTSNGRPIRYGREVRVGDIIVMRPRPHHAALVGEDINGNGLLDEDDHILHTQRRAPEYQPLRETCLGRPRQNQKILAIRR